ncbi:hypothetical protein BaRGS_00002588 [Batillaria attramentaria]|uniref:Uncharacterized protein n=1 Tax=Batillaria attramentaria TaxID=370345 RepID=A0ABD0M563_9CAEN
MIQFAVATQASPYGSDVDGTVLPVRAEVAFGRPPGQRDEGGALSDQVSPMSEGSYQEEPSPVPEPTMPEDFVIEEQQYREMEEEKQYREMERQEYRETPLDTPEQQFREVGQEKQDYPEAPQDMQEQQFPEEQPYGEMRGEYDQTEEEPEQQYRETEDQEPQYGGREQEGYELIAELGDEEFVDRREETVPMERPRLSREETPERDVSFKVTLSDYSTATAPSGGDALAGQADLDGEEQGLAGEVPEEGTTV